METPITPAGGKVLACGLDDSCPTLDCNAEMDEYAQSILEMPDGADLLTHYCGLEYVGKVSTTPEKE